MGYGKEKMYSLEVCRSRRRYFWQCSGCSRAWEDPPRAIASRRVFCVYGRGTAWPEGGASHQQHAGHPSSGGTPQMVRRSFRGREDQPTEGTASSWDKTASGERASAGGPLVGGGSCDYQAARDRRVAFLRQTACGRSIGTAGTGAGVRCQDQLVILPGQGIQQSAFATCGSSGPTAGKRLPDAACPGFPPSLYPDPGRAAPFR